MFFVFLTIYSWISFIVSLPWRVIVKPLFNWWENLVTAHLTRSIRNEGIVCRATYSSDNLPYLYLSWRLFNGSESKVDIKRIYGSLYWGNIWITNFDVHNPIKKNIGAANRHHHIVVRDSIVVKGGGSDIEYYFYPTFEFWTMNIQDLSNPLLLDGAVEVLGYGTNVSIKLLKSDLAIEGIKAAASEYRRVMFGRLQAILKGD